MLLPARFFSSMNLKPRPRSLRPYLERMEARALLATIVVTGTGDTIANDGVVTLREAITAANTNAASGDAPAGAPGLDRIEFNIPGTGVHTITLDSGFNSALDVNLSGQDPIFIDGYSQAGASANTNPIDRADNAVLKIEIRNNPTNPTSVGLAVRGAGNTIRGLAIGGFSGNGITLIYDGQPGGSVVAGNFIGTDATGTIAVPNGRGIFGSTSSTIGGTTPADRNLISGNTGNGIEFVESSATRPGPLIQGNFIGTDATGLLPLGNGGAGIFIEGFTSSTIGGTATGSTAGARNVIAASGGFGIDGVFNNAVIQGNDIGTDLTGNAPLFNPNVAPNSNTQGGIRDNVNHVTIGGTAAGAGNIIASQGSGIIVGPISVASGTAVIQGNAIGTNFAGRALLGNVGFGITTSSPDTLIGGTVAGAANIVANTAADPGNSGYGISFSTNSNISVLGNSVFNNASQGLFTSEIFTPMLTSAAGSTIVGRLDRDPNGFGIDPPQRNSTYRIEVFLTPDTGNASDNQQGKALLGFVNTTTDADGHADFMFTTGSPLPAGQFVTVTATGPGRATGQPNVTTTAYSDPIRISDSTPDSADLAVTLVDAPDPVAAGGNLSYAIALANSGPNPAQDVTLTTAVPANTTFVSFTAPAGWVVNAPAVGGTGTITATFSGLNAPNSPFTLVVRVNPGTPGGTLVPLSVQSTSTTADPNSANNAATASTTVAAGAVSADLAVTVVDAPDPVAAGGNLSYAIALANSGPNPAQDVTLTTAVPANTTFVSFTAPAGWVVNAPAVGGTGTITATFSGLNAPNSPFTLVVRVNPGTPGGTLVPLSVQSTSTTADPNSANNTATASTTVAATPVANTAPTAVDDSYSTVAGQDLVIPARGVLGNDTDAEADPLSAVLALGPANGTLTLNADGSFSYTPQLGFSGTDSFTYLASDGRLNSTPATVTIVVSAGPVTPPPPVDLDAVGPSLLGIVRYGFHAQPTHLVLGFNEPLHGPSAANLANYRLVSAGRDGRFGTRDDVVIPLRSATIDATAQIVTLVTRRPLPLRRPYQLLVRGGISDLANNGLDGGDQLLRFDRSILAGPSILTGPSLRVRPAVQVGVAVPDVLAGNQLAKFKLSRKK